MSQTDMMELRDALGAHDIDWSGDWDGNGMTTSWKSPDGQRFSCYQSGWNGPLKIVINEATPEQAIAVTLGGGDFSADDALALLDEIREADRISYDDYSQLFDAISELGSGTCELESALRMACKHVSEYSGSCPYDVHSLDCADWEERCERECEPSIDQSECWRRYFEQKAVGA